MRQAVHAAVEPEAAPAHPFGRETILVSTRELQIGFHHKTMLTGGIRYHILAADRLNVVNSTHLVPSLRFFVNKANLTVPSKSFTPKVRSFIP